MTTFIKRQNTANIKEQNLSVNKIGCNSLFKFNIENYNILSFLMSTKKEISALENTHSNSFTSFNFDYEENSVKKFDGNSSFNSLDYSFEEENNEENEKIEQILEYELDILQKEDDNDGQFEDELNKDYEQIEKAILDKNSKSKSKSN